MRAASIAAHVSSSNVTRLPTISERLNIFYRHIHNKRAPSSPPTIALNAADELLAIPFNLDERLLAAVTMHPLIPYSLISKCDLVFARLRCLSQSYLTAFFRVEALSTLISKWLAASLLAFSRSKWASVL
jgi:hypothetical protein